MAWDEGIATRHRVRGKKVDSILRRETGICHASQDFLDWILRQRNSTSLSGERRVRSSGKEFQTGSARAVRELERSRQEDYFS